MKQTICDVCKKQIYTNQGNAYVQIFRYPPATEGSISIESKQFIEVHEYCLEKVFSDLGKKIINIGLWLS